MFAWQEGYGAFTISPLQLVIVKRHSADQEAHHHQQTFQTECLEFLQQNGADYDEKYLW